MKFTRPTTTTELLSSTWQRFLAFVLNQIWLKFKNNLSIFPWRKWDWVTTKATVSAKPKQQTPSGSGGLKQVYGTPNNTFRTGGLLNQKFLENQTNQRLQLVRAQTKGEFVNKEHFGYFY